MPSADPLAEFLGSVRARGAALRQSATAPPWSLANESTAPLTLYALLRGDAWLVPAAGDPVRLAACDLAVIRGPGPHRIGDHPDTPPEVIIHRTTHCTTPVGAVPVPESAAPRLGPRSYGKDADAPIALVTGAYQVTGQLGHRLLDTLPELLTVRAEPGQPAAAEPAPGSILALLTDELSVDRPGQQAVLDRLLDLLLVRALRTWFDRPDAAAPGWYRALGDPVVGPALRALHAAPGHDWTVAGLAAVAGVSRAALARRFTAQVGEPPLTYLTHWRMALAADLLAAPDATVAAVARQVGYTDSFAFSTAFKRVTGRTPTASRPRP